MKYDLLIRQDAEEDILQAYQWYEKQRRRLGEDFIQCVEDTLYRIQNNPFQYSQVHKKIRRALISRFPYAIFYLIKNDSISIISVFHCRRNPQIWQKRNNNS